MGSPLMMLGPIVLALLGVALGVVLMLAGRRAKRLDDHPTCRRCRFDLIGLGERTEACPECGSDLRRPRAVRVGNRRARRGLIVAGLLVALVSLLAGSGFVAMRATGTDPVTLKPSWLLVWEAERVSGGALLTVLAELEQRMRADTLSESHARRLIETGLAQNVGSPKAWDGTWSDFLETAWRAGLMTPDERADYLQAALVFEQKVRARVVVGSLLSVQLAGYSGKLGLNTTAKCDFELLRLTLAGQQHEAISKGSIEFSRNGQSWRSSVSLPLAEAPLGTHTLDTTWAIRFAPESTGGVEREWTVTFTTPVTVLPPGSTLVEMLTDPATRATLESNVRVEYLRLNERNPNACDLALEYAKMPCFMVGDTVLREPTPENAPAGFRAREWVVSTHHFTPSSSLGSNSTSWHNSALRGLDAFDLDVVDVVLRPDPARAAEDPTVDTMWGEELVIRGVRVERVKAQ